VYFSRRLWSSLRFKEVNWRGKGSDTFKGWNVESRGQGWDAQVLLIPMVQLDESIALKEVKRLCKEFGFTAGMLKGSLAEGRKKS